MKKTDLRGKAKKGDGEYVFGAADTGSHACYMIYGILKPGEKERMIRPGKGHEEILAAVKGNLLVTGQYSGGLEEGHALHIGGGADLFS